MKVFQSGPSRRAGTAWSAPLCALLLAGKAAQGIEINLQSEDSIKTAASRVAVGLMDYYTGDNPGDVPGNLPAPYYWWEAGAMFGAMIDYWHYTGDVSYNDETMQAMLHQAGPNADYMPINQTKTLGNDDQAFWGMAAMSAAELNFPNPPADQPQWLALAQAVVNLQIGRWDMTTCGGGLKWQIFAFNAGYNYKNTISQAGLFNLCARLAKYTGNQTYADWAEKTWDWVDAIGLKSPTYQFFDGSDDTLNCTELNHIQWTYNAGCFLLGAAVMWNITQSEIWYQRTQGILNGLDVFFLEDTNVMYEVACEPGGNCNVDQRSFKGYLARWMGGTTQVAPWTMDFIMPKLRASAAAAAAQCSGGNDGVTCGLRWTQGAQWDGKYGVGEQMSALEIIQNTLAPRVAGPVTNDTGGTSVGDPAAGTQGDSSPAGPTEAITTGDRAGAGILTALILVGILGGGWWMIG